MRLPASVKVYAGTSNVPASRVDYAYDGAALVGYPHTGQDYITNYDESYDPYAPDAEVCDWEAVEPECPDRLCHEPGLGPCCEDKWVCHPVPVYNPATTKRGDLTSITAYADAATPALASVDTMTYDITGNVITETANCCQQRSYTYTTGYQYAYPETVTSGVGATQLTRSAVYDYNTGALRTSTDENNQTTTLHYDSANLRLYETVRPDGSTTDIIYFADQLFADPDAAHMHSAVMTISSLDASRTVRSWEFSDGGGSVARTFGENAGQGHIGASYVEYDVMGRLFRESNPYYAVYGSGTDVNPTGLWTTYVYDYLGRPATVTLQDNNTVQNSYAGVTTISTDQAGKQRRQTVDALGRIMQLDEPDANGALTQSTNYLYDPLDNLIKITQGSEQQRYFKYDSLSRLTHERQVEQDAPYLQADALTGNNYWSRKINYNADDLVTDSWDARGIQTHVTYDGLNRLSQVTYAGEPASTTTPTVTYTYDEQRTGYFNRGRLTTVTTASGGGTLTPVPQTVQALDYDRMGRVQAKRQTIGTTTYSISYSYNLLGQLQNETYPSGRVVSISHDAAARLSAISDAGQSYANAFAYAGFGGLTSETWGNGATHTRAYNNRLQLSQIKLTAGGAEKQRYDYQYGEVNVDTAVLETTKNTGQVAVVDGWIDGVKQWQQRYAYDKLGRLSIAKELNNDQTGSLAWRVDYTYDRWGNRYQGSGQGGVPVADTDIDKTRNRFVTVGSTQMVYDAAGNLTIDQKFRGMQFTYDASGRMRRTDATNGYTTSVYDAAGLRVQSVDSLTNMTRQTVYDASGRAIADYENGVWKRDYIYRGASAVLLATVEASGGARYLLTDHQGSTRVVTNQSGQVTERHDYKPFGEDVGAGVGLRTTGQGYSASNPIRQQYALTDKDSTGLNHTWFRESDSSAGRWTSPDPYLGSMNIADPQSTNRYAYVENDPVNFIDPSGLCGWVATFSDCDENGKCKITWSFVPCDLHISAIENPWSTTGGGNNMPRYRPYIDGSEIASWMNGSRTREAPSIGQSREDAANGCARLQTELHNQRVQGLKNEAVNNYPLMPHGTQNRDMAFNTGLTMIAGIPGGWAGVGGAGLGGAVLNFASTLLSNTVDQHNALSPALAKEGERYSRELAECRRQFGGPSNPNIINYGDLP